MSPPTHSLQSLPTSWALLGGGGKPAYWAPSLREIPWDQAMELGLGVPLKKQISPGTSGGAAKIRGVRGILGLVAYDDYAPRSPLSQKLSRAFIIEDLIPFHSFQTLDFDNTGLTRIHLDHKQNQNQLKLKLIPHSTKAAYLSCVGQILEDIRSGHYYQLNLLRYFTVRSAPFAALFPHFLRQSGPMGAWIKLENIEIASFSPERFVKIQFQEQDEGLKILSEPIKGTVPRGLTPSDDRAFAQALWDSQKNRAELAMIIDLMRNDLAKIAVPGSIKVPLDSSPIQLKSFPNVHHLVGSIHGSLKKGCALGSVLDALCPAGSITGAPKKAVMESIARYEQRPRGNFMGHVFWMDEKGQWDSSILIRTLVRHTHDPLDQWEFAAGSGIVIHSDPEEEYAEIAAKAGILTNNS